MPQTTAFTPRPTRDCMTCETFSTRKFERVIELCRMVSWYEWHVTFGTFDALSLPL
jgi:hypothetical protein